MQDFKVIGYMPAWKTSKMDKIRYDVLTHVIYSFAFPDEESLEIMIPNLEKANKIVRDSHKNGVKVLLSIGGWNDFGNSNKDIMMSVISEDKKLERFVENIAVAVEDLEFDGADINWGNLAEDVNNEERIKMFTQKLSEKLKSIDKTLTLSVFGNIVGNDDVVSFEVASSSSDTVKNVDWVNVICYELREGVRPSNTNLKITTEFSEAVKLPKEKTVMGVPFFINMSIMAYQDELRKNRAEETITRDILTCGREMYCISDEEFMSKVEWAKQNTIGMNVWEVTQDFNDIESSLFSKVKSVLN